MKNKNNFLKKISIRKFIIFGLLPFLLIAFWLVCSLLFNNKLSFSILLYNQNNNDIKQLSSEKIFKGGKISGEFRSKENYLGLVMLRFNDYVKHDYSSEDVLLFKIKEKGKKNWYYINDYRSGLLENQILFPFGFPVINNAKGRIYQFEIESLLGNDNNAVSLNKNNFTFLSGYQFPKSEIISSKKAALQFLVKKLLTSLTSLDFILSSSHYLLPLVIYVLIFILSPRWKNLLNYISNFFPLTMLLILLDIIFVKEFYFGVFINLTAIWIYCLIKIKLESKINFIFAFILILLWVLLVQFKISNFQNKINIWTYTFLVIGLVQSVIEEKRNK